MHKGYQTKNELSTLSEYSIHVWKFQNFGHQGLKRNPNFEKMFKSIVSDKTAFKTLLAMFAKTLQLVMSYVHLCKVLGLSLIHI